MKKTLLTLVLLIAAAIGGVALTLSKPYKGFEGIKFTEFAKGTGTMEMARRLEEAGVLQSRWQLMAARALKPSVKFQAGEYKFEKAASVWDVVERLRKGDVYLVELRIPEGYNVYEIAQAVEIAGLVKASAFIAAAKNPSMIRDLAPTAPSLEGFLFPSTYHVPRKITAEGLCRVLTDQFRREWKAVGGGSTVLDTVSLASLVEKETGAPEERAVVSAVYHNRLRKGMKLDADPTTIYAAMLLGKWRGTIYKSDLEREHPYNTYRTVGLPPGPIANPGRAAIAAALKPAPAEFIYFVARPDGSGRHIFSKSYSDHARAVAEWRRVKG